MSRQDNIDALVTSLHLLQNQAESLDKMIEQKVQRWAAMTPLSGLKQTLESILADLDLLEGQEGKCLWQQQKREFVARMIEKHGINIPCQN